MKPRYKDDLAVAIGAQEAGWLFGLPVLRYQNNGMAGWCKENSLSQWQKGGGWTVNLYGGSQTGDDWGAAFIPLNEMYLTQLTEALWSYYLTGAQTMGVNIVIWVHDPTDFKKRAEITQVGGASGLGKAAGWNSHSLSLSTTQFFFYGENTTGTGLTAGTQYSLAQFQADTLFKDWTISRISFEYGWEASGTFADVWLAEVKINGINVQLRPSPGDHIGGEIKTVTQKTAGTSTTAATMLTPAAAKRIRIISVAATNLSNTGSEIEVYFHTGANMDAAVSKAIFSAWCDTDYVSSGRQSWPEGEGPLGAVGEVVSIRTSVDITTNGRVTITYREE